MDGVIEGLELELKGVRGASPVVEKKMKGKGDTCPTVKDGHKNKVKAGQVSTILATRRRGVYRQ